MTSGAGRASSGFWPRTTGFAGAPEAPGAAGGRCGDTGGA
jgi:hypothetical protein